jgi:hypothetical protein
MTKGKQREGFTEVTKGPDGSGILKLKRRIGQRREDHNGRRLTRGRGSSAAAKEFRE